MVKQSINFSSDPRMGQRIFANHDDRVATEVHCDQYSVFVSLRPARLRTMKEIPVGAFSSVQDWMHKLRINRLKVHASVAYKNAICEMPWSIWVSLRRLAHVQQVSRIEQIPPTRHSEAPTERARRPSPQSSSGALVCRGPVH